jgi:hypothetical protein
VVLVDFLVPEPEYRRQIWDLALRPGLPRAADVDLDPARRTVPTDRRHIRSIALTAAYFAAEQAHPITMTDLVRATHWEFLELGRFYQAADLQPV